MNNLSITFKELTSSLYVLAVKIKGFHWNIVGDQFFPVHADLDCQVTELLHFADGAAELVRQINNGTAPINMESMLAFSILNEYTQEKLITAETIFPVIIKDYKTMVVFCNEIILAADTAKRQDLSDFAIGIKQYLNKYIWQYESQGEVRS